MRRLYIALLIAFATIPASFIFAAAKDDLRLLYFYSSACSPCKNIEQVVRDLSKEYKVQGLLYGKGEPEPMPFEVRTGDEETSQRYGIEDFPALVVLLHGKVKQVLRNERDIEDAKTFLYAFRKGAVSVSEMAALGQEKKYSIIGWVESRGAYFKKSKFFLTDRVQSIQVKPWLPIEAMRSLFRKTRPRLMSDVLNKPVMLRGELIKKNRIYEFVVKEEIPLDKR